MSRTNLVAGVLVVVLALVVWVFWPVLEVLWWVS